MTPQQRKALVQAVNRRIQRDGEPVVIADRGGEFVAIDQRSGEVVGRYGDLPALVNAHGMLGESLEMMRTQVDANTAAGQRSRGGAA